MEFPHPSRPGYYGVVFSDNLKSSLSKCIDILIPGNADYPSASQARVVDFLESRSSSEDRENLEQVCMVLSDKGVSVVGMQTFESENPELFEWFLSFVYYGYYASNLVLNALSARGYAYHGAPQPLGYQTPAEQPIPSKSRSSFFTTEEVLGRHA